MCLLFVLGLVFVCVFAICVRVGACVCVLFVLVLVPVWVCY